ncbi:MAG TPA: TlyA family RNA methyltransferase [bacterium]|nr:TlyA family RNA methyltransferase [bacterium]HOL47856.1 TlyA family RNA methyltransferase [bacterium]HPQ17895.1 TlyA family RNA methyltransferase [bacterium]
MTPNKNNTRLDSLLVQKNLARNKQEAEALIISGNVIVNNIKCLKPGKKFDSETSEIKILKASNKYVSIGGLKLEKLVEKYNINFKDKNVIDIGASTGGWTDFALQNGAKKVTALDVGYGIIDWRLRNNKRVELIERCNFRYFKSSQTYDIVLIDVSFISLKLLIENIVSLLHSDSIFIPLIKPQFEAGKDEISKGGIVKNKTTHLKILYDLIDNFYNNNLFLKGIVYTALKGKKGNIEYTAYFDCKKDETIKYEKLIKEVVDAAFNEVKY